MILSLRLSRTLSLLGAIGFFWCMYAACNKSSDYSFYRHSIYALSLLSAIILFFCLKCIFRAQHLNQSLGTMGRYLTYAAVIISFQLVIFLSVIVIPSFHNPSLLASCAGGYAIPSVLYHVHKTQKRK